VSGRGTDQARGGSKRTAFEVGVAARRSPGVHVVVDPLAVLESVRLVLKRRVPSKVEGPSLDGAVSGTEDLL
jgi:hypothetical protein